MEPLHAQVDLTVVISIVGIIMSAAVAAWLATARVAIANREKELDRRIDDLRTHMQGVDGRLHTEEKATIRQDGDVRLVQSTHSNLEANIHEIKRDMATKAEIQQISRMIDQFLARIEGRRPSGSTYGAVEPKLPITTR